MKNRDLKNKLEIFTKMLEFNKKKVGISNQNLVGIRVEKVNPKVETTYKGFNKF